MGKKRYVRLLIDGANMAHRMRHVHAGLSDDRGRSTGVLYGVLRAITSLVNSYTPDQIVFVWEGKDVWRRKFFSSYKSGRSARRKARSPEEKEEYRDFLSQELPDVQDILTNLGIPQLTLDGFEADDLIAALTSGTALVDSGWLCSQHSGLVEDIIVTTDSDMIQLVNTGTCRMLNPQTDIVHYQHENGSIHKSGSSRTLVAPSPDAFVYRKAIIGDTSDSISGIPGVGKKRADTLLRGRPWIVYGPAKFYSDVVRPGALNRPKGGTYDTKKLPKFVANLLGSAGEDRFLRNVSLIELRNVAHVQFPVRNSIDLDEVSSQLRKDYVKRSIGAARSTFIRSGIENEDPSVFLRYFRDRDFQFAYRRSEYVSMIRMYRLLAISSGTVCRALAKEAKEKGKAR